MKRLLALTAFIAAVPLAPAAEPLGRLFFTPQQRATLDTARKQKNRATIATEETQEAAPAPPVPETITVQGVVRRSDGKSTVWINNRAVNEGGKAGSASVVRTDRPDGSLTVHVPQAGRDVDLKVGQSLEIVSGTIEENYSRRATAPKPEPKPEPKPPAGATTEGERGSATSEQPAKAGGASERGTRPGARRSRDEPIPAEAEETPRRVGPPPAAPVEPPRGYR